LVGGGQFSDEAIHIWGGFAAASLRHFEPAGGSLLEKVLGQPVVVEKQTRGSERLLDPLEVR